jgi:hypothetical protein
MARAIVCNAFPSNIDISPLDVTPVPDPPMLDGGDDAAADAHVWVEHNVSGFCERKHKALNQFHRKLTRMLGLLDVIIFDIRNYPDIPRILAQRVARELPGTGALERLLIWVFRGDPDRVEFKDILVTL